MERWQNILADSLRTPKQLEEFFGRPFPKVPYSLLVPLRLAQKIKDQGLEGPLALQFLPQKEEGDHMESGSGLIDPIGDGVHQKGPGIIHRYRSRILVSPTPLCPVECRYCFRKNLLEEDSPNYRASPSSMKRYLHSHPEVNEVIFTGGDPLMLGDSVLDHYLEALGDFAHIRFIRFHSRMPVVIPERITDDLTEMLKETTQKKRARACLVIHINHLSELDGDVLLGLKKLQKAHIDVLAQSVLLRGVNDNISDLYDLFFGLALEGIRPYYLHHPDPVRGGLHFYLPVERGRELYLPLRDILPGHVLPHYVRDDANGTGKTLAVI
ncbi:MAG: KamA family radical SAM protein [Bacteriovoracales bacterium]|nr:KamA family radical SAM protein [Bacteriovoracales bacterium]